MLSAGLVLGALLAIEGVGSASASNDPFVPGDDCSDNVNAVGQPDPSSGGHSPLEGGSPNVINDVADPVQAAASNFTDADTAPGQADGANGQAQSQATTTGNCLNAGP
jgi:hypothetical protein